MSVVSYSNNQNAKQIVANSYQPFQFKSPEIFRMDFLGRTKVSYFQSSSEAKTIQKWQIQIWKQIEKNKNYNVSSAQVSI